LYGTDQEFYKNWSTYPFYNLTGYIFSFIRGINLSKNKFGAAVGEKLGVNKFLKNKKDIESLKKSLSLEEQEEFEKYQEISKILLNTKNLLEDEETKEIEEILFIIYFTHKIRKNVKYEKFDVETLEKEIEE
jgi:hypothetical protein